MLRKELWDYYTQITIANHAEAQRSYCCSVLSGTSYSSTVWFHLHIRALRSYHYCPKSGACCWHDSAEFVIRSILSKFRKHHYSTVCELSQHCELPRIFHYWYFYLVDWSEGPWLLHVRFAIRSEFQGSDTTSLDTDARLTYFWCSIFGATNAVGAGRGALHWSTLLVLRLLLCES